MNATPHPEPRQRIGELSNGLIEARSRLARAKARIGTELRIRNDERYRTMRKIAATAVPDMSKETLVNLSTADLREFGLRDDIQRAFNDVFETKLGWKEWAYSLIVHPTEQYDRYYSIADRTLEIVRNALRDFLDAHTGTLERLAPLRALDVEILALARRYGEAGRYEREVSLRHDTLMQLADIPRDEAYEVMLSEFLLSAHRGMLACPSTASDPPSEKDPLVIWALSLPSSLRGWDVRQIDYLAA